MDERNTMTTQAKLPTTQTEKAPHGCISHPTPAPACRYCREVVERQKVKDDERKP